MPINQKTAIAIRTVSATRPHRSLLAHLHEVAAAAKTMAIPRVDHEVHIQRIEAIVPLINGQVQKIQMRAARQGVPVAIATVIIKIAAKKVPPHPGIKIMRNLHRVERMKPNPTAHSRRKTNEKTQIVAVIRTKAARTINIGTRRRMTVERNTTGRRRRTRTNQGRRRHIRKVLTNTDHHRNTRTVQAITVITMTAIVKAGKRNGTR